MYTIRLISADATAYEVEYGPLQRTTPRKLRILKDRAYNFAFLNLDSGSTGIIEPPKADWDLVFTQYTHTFHSPSYQPYLVTGVLLNHYPTRAAKVGSGRVFSTLSLADLQEERLSSEISVIGYDRKVYTGVTYVTNAAKAYFIGDQRGYRYKLHFIDFLSNAGVKGTPKWEYQTL